MADKKTALIRNFVPYPDSFDGLVSVLREWWHNRDIKEVIIRPGEPIIFIYQEREGADGIAPSRDIKPFDILSQGQLVQVEIDEDDSPVDVVYDLFEGLVDWGKWPKVFLVNSLSSFLSWFGMTGIRSTKNVLFGIPIDEDSRVPGDIVLLGATDKEGGGYGTLVYGVYAVVDGLVEEEQQPQLGIPTPAADILFGDSSNQE